ncbi:MAG TPA: small basic family protein [Fimbriimonas sp.]|nr:small basic family protein [Fimbriimonas sp.]
MILILIPILAAIIGALIASQLQFHAVGGLSGQYLAVACLAGLDTVFGGIRSGLEGKFNALVFFTGFVSNTIIAFFIAWLGDKIYINLLFAVALVLGARIFTNLSLIRRFYLTRWQDALDKRRLQNLAQQALSSANPEPNA